MIQVCDNDYSQGHQQGLSLAGSGGQQLRAAAKALAQTVDDAPQQLIEKVRTYDRRRIDAVPSSTLYPELRGYRDRIDEQDRAKRDAGADDEVIALARSLKFYRMNVLLIETGRICIAQVPAERCRILYVPDGPDGAIHAKNVDNPLQHFKPQPPTPSATRWPFDHPLFLDGVGSGLLVDEVPPEIFPVNVSQLCMAHCTTVSQAVEFMVRYNYFWSDQNLLIHDNDGQSMALEKTACRVATRSADRRGINFITGMGALDRQISDHQHCMRQKYLDHMGQNWDSVTGQYWQHCQGQWRRMSQYVAALPDRPGLKDVNELMERRDDDGHLCLSGEKVHPDQVAPGWTLQMRLFLIDQKKLLLRQCRDGQPAYLDEREVIQYQCAVPDATSTA